MEDKKEEVKEEQKEEKQESQKQEVNKDIKKSFITIKGIKGDDKKIWTMNEYIKFKINDINKNKKEYEANINDNKEKINLKKIIIRLIIIMKII